MEPRSEHAAPPEGSEDASWGPEGGSDDPAVRFDQCDLAEIVRDSVAEASEASPSIPVEVSAPPTLPAVAEPEALGGAVRILVSAACRRTEAGSHVTVKANRADEGITVHVIDRATGVDREELSLDLARSLVALHGGILWNEPLPVGGTRVSFAIPREPPELEGDRRDAAIEALNLLADLGEQVVSPVDDPEPVDLLSALYLLDDAPEEPELIVEMSRAEEAEDPGPAVPAAETSRPETPAPVGAVPPPRPVLDPLHPATQMLRGLALDFETEVGR